MTISSSQNQLTVAGNGSQTAFSVPFVIDSASDIVLTSVASNGAMTPISSSNYSVTINPAGTNQLWGIGGTVIYPLIGSPLATGTSLLIQRILPLTQQTTVQNQGNYYAQVTEQALDTLEMQIQQISARTTQWQGTWITGFSYNVGDIVQDGTNGNNTLNYYQCVTANTSGVWATDLGNGDWSVSAFAAVPTGSLTLLGDVTGAGASPITTTLKTVNSNVGTFALATVTANAKGLITAISAGSSAGTGTVTSVTYTGDGTVHSSTPSAAVTSSGTLTATLVSHTKNTVLAGPASGANQPPTFRALVSADVPAGQFTALAVGSIVIARNTSGAPVTPGNTIAASQVHISGFAKDTGGLFDTGDSTSGTWQALQTVQQSSATTTCAGLFQRTV